MLKHLIFIFTFLFTSSLFSQGTDSLLIIEETEIPDSLNAVITDSANVTDSLKSFVTAIKDTVIPIQGEPLADVSTIINKRTFLFTNYRYTGDLLRSFSFNFIKDLGFVGQPHETFIYGVGNHGISFLQDGILLNNSFTNSLDLNLLQSEDIDSIEIVPSTRGFLYGPYNNPVTVNFITRDFIPPETYSRIKYYEGPEGEAMIDGKFSSQIMKRWNLSFQATNRSVDETYTNSEFGIWQANTKLKYFLSNSVNISGSYYFVSANQGLNGGVDFDSLSRSSNDPNTDLYDPVTAPVLNPNRTLDVTQHNFSLRTLAKPFDGSKLDLSFYYRYSKDEERNENDTSVSKRNLDLKVLGGSFGYKQESELLQLDLFATYKKDNSSESTENYFFHPTSYKKDEIYYSIGGILSAEILNDAIVPSIFYKYENKNFGDGKTLVNPGYGFDLKIAPIQSMNFYIGYSKLNQLKDNDADFLELGWGFQVPNISLELKYFEMDNFVPFLPNLWSIILAGAEIGYPKYSTKGFGLSGNYKFWILLIDANCSYYFEDRVGLPEYQLISGLYINDMFFDNNLNLKAGFKFYLTGEIEAGWYGFTNEEKIQPSNKLDFTLAGEIKGAAIFYFIWENLLGNQYYITPYYPMPERNIRFGLAWELFN